MEPILDGILFFFLVLGSCAAPCEFTKRNTAAIQELVAHFKELALRVVSFAIVSTPLSQRHRLRMSDVSQ